MTKRKVINYLRIEKPQRPGQLSECFGAGTGCGWCRTYLEKLFEMAAEANPSDAGLPSAAEYAAMRSGYVRAGGGTPPPDATPIDNLEEPKHGKGA